MLTRIARTSAEFIMAPQCETTGPVSEPVLSVEFDDVTGAGDQQDDASFLSRHLGSDREQALQLAAELGFESVDELIDRAVPASIRMTKQLQLPPARAEHVALADLQAKMSANQPMRSLIGLGYSDCITPPVIQRNVLENPGWYTAYTPYQAEIAQGRLEALLNFQTMIVDLTGMAVANASLLDEATAAAEAMAMCAAARPKGKRFLVLSGCHPQTMDVLRTRAEPLEIELVECHEKDFADLGENDPELLGALFSYPNTRGSIADQEAMVTQLKAAGGVAVVTTDLLALTLLRPPGEWGADIVVGSAQRFGVPLGFGGPHAAFMACSDAHKRRLPGRLVGVSHDADGRPALRLSLQTREQHIRREKATSNICTAQVLLAVMAGMYAVYHGPTGLRKIAGRINELTVNLAGRLLAAGHELESEAFFDTLTVRPVGVEAGDIAERCVASGFNLRRHSDGRLGISLDERSTQQEVELLVEMFSCGESAGDSDSLGVPTGLQRESDFLTDPVFHDYHTETEMMRYLHRLEVKDIALNTSMIPLGSCTMKLNAAAEMMPLSWASVHGLHPFAPADQVTGYASLAADLEGWLAEVTGFAATSLQPNAGSQGEFAGLLAIRSFHRAHGDTERTLCLIPTSAHGTNPASAVMAGFEVMPVRCDDEGNIDVEDIRAKAAANAERLGALMITYPSTHGVFEESVVEICRIIHENGGQVYMDGANMNAQVGLCRPGDLGADVCHLNLHKTFCIPHGGGGPGVGPIAVAAHLADFLPGHHIGCGGSGKPRGGAPVSAAALGSASILTISWMYVAMMGAKGLTEATRLSIVNANYVAHRLQEFFPVLYRGEGGLVAHECIIDLRPLKEQSGIDVEDVAKRLIDYGYHAPTMSWPVPGTLMIEPTESESRSELDRFCDAMIGIHSEIRDVIDGRCSADESPLTHAPHPAETLLVGDWSRSYSREQAAYPAEWTRTSKYWPPVSRIDNVFGDRNLVCTCAGMDAYQQDSQSGGEA